MSATPSDAQQDLAFIRQVVANRKPSKHGPLGIAAVWALYLAGGYTLCDFHPLAAGIWFQVGLVIGTFASWYICYRFEPFAGELDRRLGLRHALHWTVMFLFFMALVAIALRLNLMSNPEVWGSLATLALAVAFLYAGLHIDGAYTLAGIVLMIGSVVDSQIIPYFASILGITAAVALLAASFWMVRRRG
ncbi:MAG: hypothetical protein IT443_05995 [Phycisphaeraceae bacterium]|nr:hypothetical protein [Phycisphaeraceae bacterium]